jgi:hypothetical protein
MLEVCVKMVAKRRRVCGEEKGSFVGEVEKYSKDGATYFKTWFAHQYESSTFEVMEIMSNVSRIPHKEIRN